jgi:hypothetical protein
MGWSPVGTDAIDDDDIAAARRKRKRQDAAVVVRAIPVERRLSIGEFDDHMPLRAIALQSRLRPALDQEPPAEFLGERRGLLGIGLIILRVFHRDASDKIGAHSTSSGGQSPLRRFDRGLGPANIAAAALSHVGPATATLAAQFRHRRPNQIDRR